MTGEALYQLYVEANALQGVTVDSWSELSTIDRCIWHELAQLLP